MQEANMRWTILFSVLAACDPGTGGGGGDLESCELAEDSQTCPECSNGPVTCTFEDVAETANSCGDCQARGTLYQTLCDMGEEASREEIEEGTSCDNTSATN
jgi:hypothetical protein